MQMGKRFTIKRFVVVAVVLGMAISVFSAYLFFYRESNLYLKGDEQNRIRFVLFSCLHIGETTQTEIDRAADYIKKLTPNYIISAGDFLSQDKNLIDPRTDDSFMERYLDFLGKIDGKPEINVFHVSGGVHDGWDDVKCGDYDGMFRRLHKYSDMDMVKIGNLAFLFMSEIRGGINNYRVTRSQLDWFQDKCRELSAQGYNIFLVKHTNLYRTTAYTDGEGDSDGGAWLGVANTTDREESYAIRSIVNEYHRNVIMVIQGHVHIDATDKDAVGRSAFMNWKRVYGDPHYLSIKAHVLNCAGISTTMHANVYKSYQNIWSMDFYEGRSYFDLYAYNIESGQKLLHYKISFPTPFESGSPEYEQQWSPCFLDYPNIKYPNSLSDNYKIYVQAGVKTFFKAKFKFDQRVPVMGLDVVSSGNGSIIKKIAYSDDGTTFSPFTSNIPTESHRYWMVKIDIAAETKIEIYEVNLLLARAQ